MSPLPPQVGGVSSVAEWLLSHESLIGVEYATFDLERPVGIEMGGRLRMSSLPRQIRLFWRYLRWLPSSPATVHMMVSCSTVGLARDVAYVSLLRVWRRKVIAHIHGSQLDIAITSSIRGRELRLIDCLVARTVVPTPWAGRALSKLGVRAVAISNPVRIAPPTTPRARCVTSRLQLLFVGSLGERKGVPDLIAAVSDARAAGDDVTLVLVGKEEQRGEQRTIEEDISRRQNEDAITFAGLRNADEMRAHYASADVVCLPSRREVQPMALLEAMAFGLPVIASSVGGIPDLVEDGVTGLLVSPNSSDELSAAISRLARDPELRHTLGQAAMARVATVADPDVIAGQWRELYARIGQSLNP